MCADNCGSEEFQCHDGKCLSIDKRCDGKIECNNGEDEANCQIPSAVDGLGTSKKKKRQKKKKPQTITIPWFLFSSLRLLSRMGRQQCAVPGDSFIKKKKFQSSSSPPHSPNKRTDRFIATTLYDDFFFFNRLLSLSKNKLFVYLQRL